MMKIIPVLLIFLLLSFNFKTSASSSQVIKQNRDVVVALHPNKGFGIQKKAPNTIRLIELKESQAKLAEQIKSGKAIKILKNFKGETAKEDNHYFSSIKAIRLKNVIQKNKKYAIDAKVFFCSFSEKYCSVQVIQQIIP